MLASAPPPDYYHATYRRHPSPGRSLCSGRPTYGHMREVSTDAETRRDDCSTRRKSGMHSLPTCTYTHMHGRIRGLGGPQASTWKVQRSRSCSRITLNPPLLAQHLSVSGARSVQLTYFPPQLTWWLAARAQGSTKNLFAAYVQQYGPWCGFDLTSGWLRGMRDRGRDSQRGGIDQVGLTYILE